MNTFLLILASAFVAVGQVNLKWTSQALTAAEGQGLLGYAGAALGARSFWIAGLCSLVGFAFYLLSLRGLNLSQAAPMATGLVVVFAAMLGLWLLGEPVSAARAGGIACVLVGIALVATG